MLSVNNMSAQTMSTHSPTPPMFGHVLQRTTTTRTQDITLHIPTTTTVFDLFPMETTPAFNASKSVTNTSVVNAPTSTPIILLSQLSKGLSPQMTESTHIVPSASRAVFESSTTETIGLTATHANWTNVSAASTPDVWATGTNTTSSTVYLPWQQTCLLVFFTTLIVMTVLGNTLVILSVITTRRLRTVTNCFVMSLAVADWMVGIFVMPPSVLLYVYGSWTVGWILCDIWISLDILLCTASILSLCAISLDRYLAVTQPLNYKKRRTKRLAMFMIFVVWVLALAITCPPILGWYEKGRKHCRYNQNKGYVVFSAMGSFFIPMAVMLYVYTRICCVLTSRHTRMTRTEASERTMNDDLELDPISEDYASSQHTPSKRKYSMRAQHQIFSHHQQSVECAESHHTLYELVEISKSTSTIRTSSTITNYKFSAMHHQFKPIPFCPTQTSLAETCMCGHHPSANVQRMPRQPSVAGGLGSHGKRVPIRISSSKRETKAAKTLSMVVGGFIACWLPFFVYYLLIPFLPRESVSTIAMSVLTWLGWVNSAINPFIYAFYNSDFRIAFWRLTFRRLCKTQTTHRAMLKT